MVDELHPETEMSRETDAADRPAPPATLEFLVHTLFTQALMALGRIPNPITGKASKNLPTARHFIDTIAMLQEKTRGNCTQDEVRLLEEVLHQGRLQVSIESGGGNP